MAVGNAVVDVVLEDGFLENVSQRGLRLKQKLAGLADQFPDIIEDVRGAGLMMGLKCKIPNTDMTQALFDQKLLVIPAGENVVRIIPPLIISDDDLDEAVVKLEAACTSLRQSQKET